MAFMAHVAAEAVVVVLGDILIRIGEVRNNIIFFFVV